MKLVLWAQMKRWGLFVPGLVVVMSLSPTEAAATYSVVAVDSRTQHVGGAGTSCVGPFDVGMILGVAPGRGAVHAQALINTAGRDRAVQRLMEDVSAQAIIDEITGPGFDPAAAQRQYGVASLLGGAAGFTGATNGEFASDRQGRVETGVYSIQGNILTSVAVLDGAESAFVRGAGCDLPERMMLALEAGAADGQGDSRCTPDGVPSDSAFIRVVDAQGLTVLDLTVTDTASVNPMLPLRAAFDAWRVDNPCPDPPAETTGAEGSSGRGEPPESTTSTTDTTVGDPADPTRAESSAGASTRGGSEASAESDSGDTPSVSNPAGGCGCGLAGRGSGLGGVAALGLLAIGGAWRRRRCSPPCPGA